MILYLQISSVVHTGNREFCCPHCTQRFGRKDHMTRHAKKTHASFYTDPAQPALLGPGVRPGGGGGGRTRYGE